MRFTLEGRSRKSGGIVLEPSKVEQWPFGQCWGLGAIIVTYLGWFRYLEMLRL